MAAAGARAAARAASRPARARVDGDAARARARPRPTAHVGARGTGTVQPATVAQLQARLSQQALQLAAPVRRAQPDAATSAGGAPDAGVRPAAGPADRGPAPTRLAGPERTSPPAPSRCPARGRTPRPADPAALAAAGDVTGDGGRVRRRGRAPSPRTSGSRVLAAWRLVRGRRHLARRRAAADLARPSWPRRGWTAGSPSSGCWARTTTSSDAAARGGRGGPAAGRATGADTEAALHDQVVQLAARPRPARRRRTRPPRWRPTSPRSRSWVLRGGDPAQAGVALSRLVAARQLAAPERRPDRPAPTAATRPRTRRSRSPTRWPPASRCCRRCPATTSTTSSSARWPGCCGSGPAPSRPDLALGDAATRPWRLLPDRRPAARARAGPRRPGERRCRQLDPPAAVDVYRDALDDAARARDDALRGSLLGQLAALRHTLGDVDGRGRRPDARAAAARPPRRPAARRAGPLRPGPRAARRRPRRGGRPRPPRARSTWPSRVLGGRPGHAGRAGRPAAAAAPELARRRAPGRHARVRRRRGGGVLGETQHARDLAELGAGWHRRNGNVIAEAEAWQLLARAAAATAAENAAALGPRRGPRRRRRRLGPRRDLPPRAGDRRATRPSGRTPALAVVADAVSEAGGARRPAGRAARRPGRRRGGRAAAALAPAGAGRAAGAAAGARRAVRRGAGRASRDLDGRLPRAGRRLVGPRRRRPRAARSAPSSATWTPASRTCADAAEEAMAAGDEHQTRELAVRLAAVLDDAGAGRRGGCLAADEA